VKLPATPEGLNKVAPIPGSEFFQDYSCSTPSGLGLQNAGKFMRCFSAFSFFVHKTESATFRAAFFAALILGLTIGLPAPSTTIGFQSFFGVFRESSQDL